jgi:hypothetical protein
MPAGAHGGAPAHRGRPVVVAALLALAPLLAACGSSASSVSSTVAESVVDPVRITIAGDSIMRELSAPLEAALEQPGIEVDYALLPAIATPSVVTETEVLVAEHDPDVVLMMIGTWEGIGVDTRIDGWQERYRLNVLDPFVNTLADHDVDLVWLGYPPFPPSPEELRHTQLNDAYANLPESFPTVSWVDAGDAVAADDGSFLASVDIPGVGVVPLRQSDGRHLCPDGASLMAEAVLVHLEERFGVTPVDGWQRDAWREDPANFEHPEQCPGVFPPDAEGTPAAEVDADAG